MKVCIDPGHGGSDPGASFDGIREKDVTLSIARELERLLEGSYIQTLATRSSDVFVNLYDRPKIANAWNADLFISIHTNADQDPDEPGMPEARGEEAFYLSVTGKRLAEAIGKGLRTEFPDEPWRGVKQRGLHVLRHTRAPAVLVEVAFIDHSDSNRKLKDPAVRRQIAFGILRGILTFEGSSNA